MTKQSAPAADPSTRRRIPSEFSDISTWAAWLYYVDEMTQSEVAKAIGTSRVTVIKLLNEAKEQGLVSVRINPRMASRVSLSRRLSERWGLNSTLLVPDNPRLPLVDRLGKAGAFALMDSLVPGDIIGVAWGRTILSVVHNLRLEAPVPDLTVVQVSASPNGLSADFSPELCVSLLANKLGARSVNLMAPAIVSSPELRTMLMDEPSIRNQMNVIRSANKVFFGVGQLTEDATLRASELHSTSTIDAVMRDGGVCAILGRFLNEWGTELTVPSHDRMLGLSLEELKHIPQRVCVAGGPNKIKVILAALRGGYVTDLVTDLPTAELLYEEHEI